MQFAYFALVCVVAVQAVLSSKVPAAGQQVAGKTIDELNQEFIKAGTQLQADLKNARANADLKDDTHAQVILNAVEETDKKIETLEKNLMDPKHPLSESEVKQLISDIKTLVKKIKSERHLVKRQNKKTIREILIDLTKRGLLLKEIAEKQDSNPGKILSKESLLVYF